MTDFAPGDKAQLGLLVCGPRRRSWMARIFDWRDGRRPWHSHAERMVLLSVLDVDPDNAIVTVGSIPAS